jgi:putative acetyltransferase
VEECASRAEVIRPAHSPRDIAHAHALFVEYAQGLQVDLCFQGFEEELATLPGAYAPPRGRLLLAGAPDSAFGCIALRPLAVTSPGTEGFVGEVKRLYVRTPYRRQGWGLRLARALLDEARMIGYRELRLDTFDWMTSARALYSSLGFRDRAPYYDNPLAGVVYMACTL